MTSPGSTYDDFPSPDFPTAPRDRDRELPVNLRFARTSESEDREHLPSGGLRPHRSRDDYDPPVVARRGDDPGTNERLFDRDPIRQGAKHHKTQPPPLVPSSRISTSILALPVVATRLAPPIPKV